MADVEIGITSWLDNSLKNNIIDAVKDINNISIREVPFSKIDSYLNPLIVLLLENIEEDEHIPQLIQRYLKSSDQVAPILIISSEYNFDYFHQIKLLNEFQDCFYLKAPFDISDLEQRLQFLKGVPAQTKHDAVDYFIKETGERFFSSDNIHEVYKKVNERLFISEYTNNHLEHDIYQKIAGIEKGKISFDEQFDIFHKKCISDEVYKNWLTCVYELEREGLLQNYTELIYSLGKSNCIPPVNVPNLKILIVDNNPNSFLQDIRVFCNQPQVKARYEFYIKEKGLPELLKKLRDEHINTQNLEITDLTCIYEQNKFDKLKLIDVDLILLDLNLGRYLKGQDFLKQLYKYYPEIPVFIVSSSEDFNIIRETLKNGADFYVPKARLISLPYKINHYFKELGDLIWLAKEKTTEERNTQLRRNLIGNIRRLMFDNQTLWFGDKCYHMINHSFLHAHNNWKIANQIVPPIIDFLSKQKGLSNLTDDDIYCFCMAIWLHDIGHKGNERYGEPHAIRDVHGLISAELILKHPEHYGIFGYDGSVASPYRWVSFRHPKTAPQIIRERFATLSAAGKLSENERNGDIRKMTLLERIALLCLYHKSNFPLDDDDVKTMLSNGKRIPLDCYENFDRETEPIHLKSICDLTRDDNLMKLAALFRLIDGIDINRNRVGEEIQEAIKTETIERDLKQQLFKLKEDVCRIRDAYLKGTGKEKRFVTLFFENVFETVMARKGVNKQMRKEQQQFLDAVDQNIALDNYYMLVDYIQYIAVQNGHFKLHNSISELEIEPILSHKNLIRFNIKYKTDKDKADLDSKDVTVKEWREAKGRTIRDHLLGKRKKIEEFDVAGEKPVQVEYRIESGYVRREMNNGGKYLKNWFDLEKTKISICDIMGNLLFEEMEEKKS